MGPKPNPKKELKAALERFLKEIGLYKAAQPGNRAFKRAKTEIEYAMKKAGMDEKSDDWKLLFGDSTFAGIGFSTNPIQQKEIEKREYSREIDELEDAIEILLKQL